MNIAFSRQIVQKYSSIKFHENPSSGSRVFPCGLERRTDIHDEANIAFRSFVNAPKNNKIITSFILNLFKYDADLSDYVIIA